LLVHHFYPKTSNIGDHFVQRGIQCLLRSLVRNAEFRSFNVNPRGDNQAEYGLTRKAVERANSEADLIVIGGSNLYEGRTDWGVYLEPDAISNLAVPVMLLGIGTGSRFLARAPQPSRRVRNEIIALNNLAAFSGVRDVITLNWLRSLGVTKAELMGDPATFIFNRPFRTPNSNGKLLIVVPSARYLAKNFRDIWDFRMRAQFRLMATLAKELTERNYPITVICNDPGDEEAANQYFGAHCNQIVRPETPDEYFEILESAQAVVSGRLHTAIVAFSLGIPFTLMDVDERTRGFIKTYDLDNWSVRPSWRNFQQLLRTTIYGLLDANALSEWESLIGKRNLIYERTLALLGNALDPLSPERGA
jgi:polysaccharide pyruvyl transferase WcaK-like protein